MEELLKDPTIVDYITVKTIYESRDNPFRELRHIPTTKYLGTIVLVPHEKRYHIGISKFNMKLETGYFDKQVGIDIAKEYTRDSFVVHIPDLIIRNSRLGTQTIIRSRKFVDKIITLCTAIKIKPSNIVFVIPINKLSLLPSETLKKHQRVANENFLLKKKLRQIGRMAKFY